MDPKEYELMYQVELHHWWYLGMQSITEALLDRYYPYDHDLAILDAGCGTGAASTTCLAKYGAVTGIDISPIALKFSQERGMSKLGRASVEKLPFSSAVFDLVTSFDVLYEDSVSEDVEALREFARVLSIGGRLLLRLPAYDWLRGHHDRVTRTARRYTSSRVKDLIGMAGMEVEQISYANTILFPLALVKRTTERISGSRVSRSDLAIPFGTLNGLFRKILSIESRLIPRHQLPYGLSVIAIARKNK